MPKTNNTPCIFDCETTARPLTELESMIPVFEANKTYKDPEKIAADLAKKKAEWLDSAALSAQTGQIVIIGTRRDGVTEFLEGDEKHMLETFWRMWSESHPATFIGHNCFNFDVPFLMRRAWMLGVTVPAGVMDGRGRYLSDRWADTMAVWSCGSRQSEAGSSSLDAIAKALTGKGKSGNGKDFAALYKADKAAALSYLDNDLQLTESVAKKMGMIV